MRKALFPMIASLALCGAATAALIVKAHAGQAATHRPLMVAALTPSVTGAGGRAAPPPEMLRDTASLKMGAEHRARFCKDLYARKVGNLAFLETKLSLTPVQAPLFARWKDAALDIAKRREGECATPMHAAADAPSIVDRMGIEETLLKQRLADIAAERPALAALYGALTPTQKEEFGQGGMRRMAGGMRRMMGLMNTAPEMGAPESPDGPPPPR